MTREAVAASDVIGTRDYGGLTQAEIVRAFKMYNEGLTLSNQHKIQQRQRYLMDMKNTSEGIELEGVLKIRWGVRTPIRLQRNDEAAPIQFQRSFRTRVSAISVFSQLERDSFNKRRSLYHQKRPGWNDDAATSTSDAPADTPIDGEDRPLGSSASAPTMIDETNFDRDVTDVVLRDGGVRISERAMNYDSLPKNFSFRNQDQSFDRDSDSSSLHCSFFLSDTSEVEDSSGDEAFEVQRRSSSTSFRSLPRSDGSELPASNATTRVSTSHSLRDAPTSSSSSRGSRRKRRLKKGASINGHLYRELTRTFVPDYGSETNVRVKQVHTAIDVIDILKEKFRIENPTKEFQLYIVKENGETRAVDDEENPLITRLKLGPCESDSKIFIMERNATPEISAEVAEMMHVPQPILNEMLARIETSWMQDMEAIRNVYTRYKDKIMELIKDVEEKEHWV